MERRELLKALAIVPFVRPPFEALKELPIEKAAAVEVAPHKYWVFVDSGCVDIDSFVGPWPWPDCDAEIFPVKCFGGRTVQDTIAIYKIGESHVES